MTFDLNEPAGYRARDTAADVLAPYRTRHPDILHLPPGLAYQSGAGNNPLIVAALAEGFGSYDVILGYAYRGNANAEAWTSGKYDPKAAIAAYANAHPQTGQSDGTQEYRQLLSAFRFLMQTGGRDSIAPQVNQWPIGSTQRAMYEQAATEAYRWPITPEMYAKVGFGEYWDYPNRYGIPGKREDEIAATELTQSGPSPPPPPRQLQADWLPWLLGAFALGGIGVIGYALLTENAKHA